mmetsp:Transcript_27969/g.63276  ORF Transcript_27969/g.63276 Transcript_27969/m.63276 type:complete len:470 (-) Transcript_27969:82-1491(-)
MRRAALLAAAAVLAHASSGKGSVTSGADTYSLDGYALVQQRHSAAVRDEAGGQSLRTKVAHDPALARANIIFAWASVAASVVYDVLLFSHLQEGDTWSWKGFGGYANLLGPRIAENLINLVDATLTTTHPDTMPTAASMFMIIWHAITIPLRGFLQTFFYVNGLSPVVISKADDMIHTHLAGGARADTVFVFDQEASKKKTLFLKKRRDEVATTTRWSHYGFGIAEFVCSVISLGMISFYIQHPTTVDLSNALLQKDAALHGSNLKNGVASAQESWSAGFASRMSPKVEHLKARMSEGDDLDKVRAALPTRISPALYERTMDFIRAAAKRLEHVGFDDALAAYMNGFQGEPADVSMLETNSSLASAEAMTEVARKVGDKVRSVFMDADEKVLPEVAQLASGWKAELESMETADIDNGKLATALLEASKSEFRDQKATQEVFKVLMDAMDVIGPRLVDDWEKALNKTRGL